MTRAVFTSATVAALIAAAGGGFIAGRSQRQPAGTSVIAVMTPAAAQDASAPIYYQDPDGRPLYSLTPTKTPDGRDYRPVPADADVSFEQPSHRGDRAGGSKDQILPQPDGAAGHITGAEEGLDGDGLCPRL